MDVNTPQSHRSNRDRDNQPERDWQTLYTIFADLWKRYSDANPNEQIGRYILNNALNPLWSFERVAREIRSFHLPIDLSKDWHELEQLRKACDDSKNLGLSPGAPAASVYQTAVQIKRRQLEHEIDREGEPRWFYRGQRKAQWSIQPLTFRDLKDTPDGGKELRARVSRVRGVVRALQEAGLGNDEFQALAIAQHYSRELAVNPWLLDVTHSPYVALFFASCGAEDGDVGVIDYIERTEWLFFSAGAPNSIGKIRYASPEGIPRIKNQTAFFIEAPHPELYRQLSIRRYYFCQKSGVVFEDASCSPPVSQDLIYPKHDPILESLPREWSGKNSLPLTWEPPPDALKHPDEDLFASIVRPWDEAKGLSEGTLIAICSIHAAVTRRRDLLPHYIGTLHHLRQVAKWASRNISWPSWESVKNLLSLFYVDSIKTPDAAHNFKECVIEANPECEPMINELLESHLDGL